MKTHTEKCQYAGEPYEGSHCTCDGYHTFDELYEHRIVLYMALARKLVKEWVEPRNSGVWCSTKHYDNSTFDGWFILGIGKETGKQITYHIPDKYWNEACEFAELLPHAPEWDKHTSDDVIKRIQNL